MFGSVANAEKQKGIAMRNGENTFICHKSKYSTCFETLNPDDNIAPGAKIVIYFYDENRPTVGTIVDIKSEPDENGEENVEFQYIELEYGNE